MTNMQSNFTVGDKAIIREALHHRLGETTVVIKITTGHIYPVRIKFADGAEEPFKESDLELVSAAGAEEEEVEDVVNSPSHYTQYPVEVIELTRHLNFCRGNAVKYIARAGHKDKAKELEDLKKAAWYIADEIKQLEEAK